jgi:starvation-inducible outer membrane lipoprotein
MSTLLRRCPPLVAVVLGVTGCSAAPSAVQEAFAQRHPGFEDVARERQPYGCEDA